MLVCNHPSVDPSCGVLVNSTFGYIFFSLSLQNKFHLQIIECPNKFLTQYKSLLVPLRNTL